MLDKATIENLLTALGKQIDLMNKGPIRIVVCDGASLNVLGQIRRTTKDIDVLGILEVEKSGDLKTKKAVFPAWFIEAANRVKKDFNLPDSWLNAEPASLVSFGLPEGFEQRLTKKRYSRSIFAYFISRLDQIHFKLYASVDRGGHHIQDLLSLSPKDDEINQAASWCMTHDVSEGFKLVLADMLKKLGFQNIDESI